MDTPTVSPPTQKRQAAMIFILITLFIDILGIGIIIPILPELIKEFVGGDTPPASMASARPMTNSSQASFSA